MKQKDLVLNMLNMNSKACLCVLYSDLEIWQMERWKLHEEILKKKIFLS